MDRRYTVLCSTVVVKFETVQKFVWLRTFCTQSGRIFHNSIEPSDYEGDVFDGKRVVVKLMWGWSEADGNIFGFFAWCESHGVSAH